MFENEFEKLVNRIEKGFVNHPNDSGGATKFGVTEWLARKHGYTGDMRDLPIKFAGDIFRIEFWDPLKLDKIAMSSPNLASEMFESSVLGSPKRVALWLQRVLNVLNQQSALYPDLKVDGIIGSNTLNAVAALRRRRGRYGFENVTKAMNCLQGVYLIERAEKREANETFIYGWLDKRI